jgi:hypothetical protein
MSSGLSTLIPQGKEITYYSQNYSSWMAGLITTTQFNRFFQSALFLFPVIIFFLNLLTCAIVRLAKRLKSKAKKRFGPDIIHIGLLLLMIGGLLSPYGRNEQMVSLSEGESTLLPGGYKLVLNSFKFLKYGDGRPKDWLSNVDVFKNGTKIKSHTIEVNKPLRIGKVKVYQNSYNQDVSATVSTLFGETFEIRPGDYYTARNAIIIFRDIEVNLNDDEVAEKNDIRTDSGVAVFEELSTSGQDSGHSVTAVHRLSVSEEIDGFTMEKFSIASQTGLQIVEDPSTIPVIISLILIGLGLSLTFIQKMGDKNI